MQNYR
jgi:hypothetical protein